MCKGWVNDYLGGTGPILLVKKCLMDCCVYSRITASSWKGQDSLRPTHDKVLIRRPGISLTPDVVLNLWKSTEGVAFMIDTFLPYLSVFYILLSAVAMLPSIGGISYSILKRTAGLPYFLLFNQTRVPRHPWELPGLLGVSFHVYGGIFAEIQILKFYLILLVSS